MTVWVLKQGLDAEAELHIGERTAVMLPFEDLPDLSQLNNPNEALRLLTILHPNDPPESIKRRLDRFWHLFTTIEIGDLLAVPLPHSKQVALAEVTGPYRYRVGDNGSDLHEMPVRWVRPPMAINKFRKYKAVFELPGAMFEIMDREARTALRDQLPHSYNRFSKLKWLLIMFMIMNIIGMLAHMH